MWVEVLEVCACVCLAGGEMSGGLFWWVYKPSSSKNHAGSLFPFALTRMMRVRVAPGLSVFLSVCSICLSGRDILYISQISISISNGSNSIGSNRNYPFARSLVKRNDQVPSPPPPTTQRWKTRLKRLGEGWGKEVPDLSRVEKRKERKKGKISVVRPPDL